MADESTPSQPVKPQYEKAPNFISTYANNIYLESSTWDLKLIFGQLDQSEGTSSVKQHVAVTIPWTQAKLLSFFLRVHLRAEEKQDGKIHIRPDVRPTEMDLPTEEQMKDPDFMEFYEFVKKLREEFIADA
jgi:hypothetical protein